MYTMLCSAPESSPLSKCASGHCGQKCPKMITKKILGDRLGPNYLKIPVSKHTKISNFANFKALTKMYDF